MNKRSYLHLSIGAVSLLLIDLVLAMPAAANHFTCRASALRIVEPLGLFIEPVVANPPDNPCVAESKSLLSFSSVLGISTGVLDAKTTGAAHTAPATAEGSAANVKLVHVLNLVNVTAAVLDAKAKVVSVSGKCVFSSNSSVTNANVQGTPITLLTTPLTIPIVNLLGLRVATLFLNATIGGPHPTIGSPNSLSVTQRALWLHVNVLGGLLGLEDVIVGEATADVTGLAACSTG
jgi:hypothetical protein